MNLSTNNNVTASVSVVIPCYKCNLTIERAIDSVVMQTVKPAEIIIVNDNSREDVDGYIFNLIEEKYSKIIDIKYIQHINNFGAPAARNTGIMNATKKYIALLDADDSWTPNKIELQFKLMEKNPDVCISGHSVSVGCNSSILKNNIDIYNLRKLSMFELLLRNPLPTPTLMFKKSLSVRFDEEMRCIDDHLLLMDFCLRGAFIFKFDNPCAVVHKAMFGYSGLSGNLHIMEFYEILAYSKISWKHKWLLPLLPFFLLWSFVKYFKRLVQISIRHV